MFRDSFAGGERLRSNLVNGDFAEAVGSKRPPDKCRIGSSPATPSFDADVPHESANDEDEDALILPRRNI
jgi:hypothetical protein